MPSKILVPIDLGQQDAAAVAVFQARQFDSNAKIVLLHVAPNIPEYIATHIPPDALRSNLEDARKELQAFAKDNGLSGDTQIVLRQGSPGREILNHAAKEKPALIVMASHDPGIGDFVLGSVAAFVVRHAHCSVLVVRDPDD